jgi:carbonic anhydrase
MKHDCTAVILHCIDFRFGRDIKAYLEKKGLLGDADTVAIAGSAKNLVSPAAESDREFVLRQLDISKRLHRVCRVILMNHTDCGAYGGRSAFGSDEDEERRHRDDLSSAASIIRRRHPDLEVVNVLARLAPDGSVAFRECSAERLEA